jgi:dCMP deaminase
MPEIGPTAKEAAEALKKMAMASLTEPEEPHGSRGRVSRQRMFLSIAYGFGQRSSCPRAQVGAILTREGRIVSSGYVGAPSGAGHCYEVGCELMPDGGCSRTVHAEANAIAWAARAGVELNGTIMYCTHEPCLHCAKLIVNAGVVEVVFKMPYRLHDGHDLLTDLGVRVVYAGIDERDS